MIISAVKFEADPVLSLLDNNHISYDFYEFGIGPINAAKSSVKLKESAAGKNTLYLGSAGSFASFSEPYLCRINQVYWLPTGERIGQAKYMEGLHEPLMIKGSGHFELPEKKALTSTSVSLNADIKVEALPQKQQLVENMEAYAIVSELIEVVNSLDIIWGITNEVGPHGSEQWSENFKQVAQLTANFLEPQLGILRKLSMI